MDTESTRQFHDGERNSVKFKIRTDGGLWVASGLYLDGQGINMEFFVMKRWLLFHIANSPAFCCMLGLSIYTFRSAHNVFERIHLKSSFFDV